LGAGSDSAAAAISRTAGVSDRASGAARRLRRRTATTSESAPKETLAELRAFLKG